MDEYKEYMETYTEWRKLIFKSIIITTIAVFIVEIIMFFGMLPKIDVPIPQYLFCRIAIPTLINGLNILICIHTEKNTKIDQEQKNNAVIIMFTVMCATVSCIHSFFVPTLTTYTVPIVASSIFGSKKICKRVTLISVVGAVAGSLISTFDGRKEYDFRVFELVIAIVLILISYLITLVLMMYEERKRKIIKAAVQNELELKEKLNYDGLTGLYNYSAFSSLLEKELVDKEENVMLAIIDIDDFKSVNDLYGHENGNVVIKKLAELLGIYCTSSGFPARYGGEEFAVVFIETSAEKAKDAIELVRINLAESRFENMERVITFSCGLVKCRRELTLRQIIEKSDEAMYKAKSTGKNKTIYLEDVQ